MDANNGWFEDWMKNNKTLNKKNKKTNENNKPFKQLKTQTEKSTKNINNINTRKFEAPDKQLFDEWLNSPSKKVFDKDTNITKNYKYTNKNIISIDSSIDLHNLTVHEAINTLKNFLITSYKQNLSIIQIIHGKGKHSQNSKPKIKNAVINYLHKDGKNLIFRFKEAPNKYGGKGATIIWLKK